MKNTSNTSPPEKPNNINPESKTNHTPSVETVPSDTVQPNTEASLGPIDNDATSPSASSPLAKATRKISKSSLIGRKRNGSIASSTARANKGATSQAAPKSSKSTGPDKKAGGSKFLSFLNCCGNKDDSDDIDLDEHSVPARKSNKLQANQIAGGKSQDISGAESSTAESKDVSVEKIGGPPYSEMKSAGEPKIQDNSRMSPGAASKGASSQSAGDEGKTDVTSKTKQQPQLTKGLVDKTHEQNLPETAVVASIDNKTIPPLDESTSSEKGDVDMTEAPPLDSVVVDASKEAEENRTDVTPPLPPPPPPPITPRRQLSAASSQHNRNSSNQASGVNDQQKWLLPPIRPEFKGKKCLVLDLDETLVHSSFKVNIPAFSRPASDN